MAENDLIPRTTEFSKKVIRFFKNVRWTIESDIVRKQVIRSATSIGANLIEAKYASTRKEFIQYNHIALRSSGETSYWLELFSEMDTSGHLNDIKMECVELSKILSAILIKTKSKS